ncbi:MAG: T9SS type B sorting domain-containing protein [Chitinophagales bacterium]|nr:T9SS type B sorting domain-containing protein [Chitinophagales bacterium]
MRIAITIVSLFIVSALQAQLFYNGGAQITLTNGAVMIVKTGDLLNDNGVIDNAGAITVEGSITNNDTLTGGNTAGGMFILDGDWINNAFFKADQSLVNLRGGNQLISGAVVSNFYDLTGSGSGIKQLDNLNAFVGNQLDITDVEFATVFDTLFITNPATNAILRSDGFVSSLGDGRLSRATNSIGVYLFPVGSSAGIGRYRPIEITPNTGATQEFGVRFANIDPTFEAYDRMMTDDILCMVNPLFYHHIDRIQGSDPADIKMFYSYFSDGEWSRMAHWQGAPNRWEEMGTFNPGVKNGFETLDIFAWDNFSTPAYALAVIDPVIDAGDDEEILIGESVQLDPVYFGPPIDSIIWSPAIGLDCIECEEPTASPTATTIYTISIKSNLGCWVTDSLEVEVNSPGVLFPTGFSPDNDGMNDIFKPFNDNFEELYYAVYNRWGELMFESVDPTMGWDGTHNGKPQAMDNYIFFVEYRFRGQTAKKSETGNVTLLR